MRPILPRQGKPSKKKVNLSKHVFTLFRFYFPQKIKKGLKISKSFCPSLPDKAAKKNTGLNEINY